MDYDRFVDLDNVILQDCCGLYDYKSIETVIEDGRVTGFMNSDKEIEKGKQ